MREEKRKQVQEFLRSSRERMNRNDEEVYSLSSDTLKRISHFYNKDSKVIVSDQMELLRREEEKKRLMQKILEEELNS